MISICIPTYNGEKYVQEQLDSILCQLGEQDEIIISDDGSTDKTITIIKEYKDNRIKIFYNNSLKGTKYNIENALNNAVGEYIFLADQDDIWTTNKIRITMEYLKCYSLVISDCKVVDANLNVLNESFFKISGSRKNKIFALMFITPYLGCCMAFNRKILEKCLPFPKSNTGHDIWIGNISAFAYNVKFISDKLVFYRRHGNNVSGTTEKSVYSFYKKSFFRFDLLQQLVKRLGIWKLVKSIFIRRIIL